MDNVQPITKPSNMPPNRTTKGISKKKPITDFIWNDNDIKAYEELGLEVPYRLGLYERRFLSQVDIEKAPIQRTVTMMVRLKSYDWLSVKDTDKRPERKEYIWYQERWTGKNKMGLDIMPVSHTMGYYQKQFVRAHQDSRTGDIDYNVLDPSAQQTIYYIPFGAKKVNEIISNSARSDKNTIVFTIKFASEDAPPGMAPRADTRAQFSYDQFCNWKWDDLYKFHTQPHVDAWVNYYQKKGLTGNNLAFEPT